MKKAKNIIINLIFYIMNEYMYLYVNLVLKYIVIIK